MATTLRGDDNFDSASPIPSGNFTAKAWVNATNGNTINGSGNISSIFDEGVGRYQANMSNAVSSAHGTTFGSRVYGSVNEDRQGVSIGAVSTTYFEFGGGHNQYQGAYEDGNYAAGLIH
tara:strand:+ start:439 stop:795 length:357 start_codon:yes stop_codon:yes gene_type:complete